MILAIDIGNTNIVVGCIDENEIYFTERLSTVRTKTELEYAVDLKTILDIYHIKKTEIEGCIISSVVPQITNIAKLAVEKILKKKVMVLGPGIKTGLNILMDQEHVKIDRLLGHGGLFKTKGVGQQILADAVNAPVSVMSTAGEGGAWGIALLAAYLVDRKEGETLDEFLDNRVFAGNEGSTLNPEPEGVKGFNEFMDRYLKGLPIERAAVESKIW